MSKLSPEKNFILEETVANSPETAKNQHPKSAEALVGLRSDLAKFYRINQKLRAINGISAGNDAPRTAEQLNAILRRQGIGWTNAGPESKAYFATNGKDVVLVANTVVDGRPVSSRDAVLEAFNRIDSLISDPFSRELATLESQVRDVNREYHESTNDLYRIADALVNAIGGKGGDTKYEAKIDAVRKKTSLLAQNFNRIYFERMEVLRPKIDAENLSPSEFAEVRVLESQKRRFEALLWSKLERPEWITQDVAEFLWETKGDMGRNAVEFVKGVGQGAFDAFFGTIILTYKLSTDEQVRAALSESASRAYEFCKQNATKPEKFYELFKETLSKEYERVKKLPPNEQANYIGQLTGTVLAALVGVRMSKDLLSSNTLRIRKNHAAAETLVTKRAIKNIADVRDWDGLEAYVRTIDRVRMRDGMNGEELGRMVASIRTGNDPSLISKLPHAGGIRSKAKEIIENGGYVSEKTGWRGQIDRANSTNLVDLGADRAKAANRFVREKFFGQTFTNRVDALGAEFSSLRKIHDIVDERMVTALRVSLSRLSENAKAGMASGAKAALAEVKYRFDLLKLAFPSSGGPSRLASALAKLEAAFPELADAVSKASAVAERSKGEILRIAGDTKDRTLEVLAKTKESALSAKESAKTKGNDLMDRVTGVSGASDVLPRNLRKGLVFEWGFALHEVSDASGQKLLRFVDVDGKFLKGPDGKILQFPEASHFTARGAVVRAENGAYGLLDRAGKWILSPKEEFQSIRHLSDAKKVVQSRDGIFRVIDLSGAKVGRDGRLRYKVVSQHDFITDPQEGHAIGVSRKFNKDGTWTTERFVLSDGEGGAQKTRRKLNYQFVDHFTDEGFAAAMTKTLPDWRKEWVVIGRDGRPFEGVKVRIAAEDPASALQKFRERRIEERMKKFPDSNADEQMKTFPAFHRHKDLIFETLLRKGVPGRDEIKVLPTTVDSVYVLQREVDGKVLKGYFNVRTKQFAEPQFNAVFSDDAAHGFVRVKTADGQWGILNSEKGGYYVKPGPDAPYSSIQILDAKTGLFETQVTKTVNGTSRPRLGVIGLNGKEYVKPEYDFIQSPRDGLYQGVNFGSEGDYSKIVSISRELDISRIRAVNGGKGTDHSFGSGLTNSAASDPLSATIAGGMYALDASKVAKKGENVYQLNGSLALQELKKFGKEGFFRADEALFGKGAKKFEDFLAERSGGKPILAGEKMKWFDQYASERIADFIRNYSKDGSRSVSKAEYAAIMRSYVGPIREEFERGLRPHLNPFGHFGGFKIVPEAKNDPAWNRAVWAR